MPTDPPATRPTRPANTCAGTPRAAARRWIVCLLLPALLLGFAPAFAPADVERGMSRQGVDGAGEAKLDRPYRTVRALCIGVNQYHAAIFEPLTFAENDAREVGRLFTDLYGYETTVLLGARATRANILATLDKLIEASGPEDVLIIYYAGHGHTLFVQDRAIQVAKGFIVPSDADINHDNADDYQAVRSIAIEGRDLVDRINRASVKHGVLILDCCFSGIIASQRAGAIKQKNDAALLWSMAAPSRTAMTAGHANQKSYEYRPDPRKPQHGFFTYALLDTLKANRAIGLTELIAEVHGKVQRAVSDEIPRGPGKPTVPMTPRITFLGSHSGVFAFIQDPAKPWIEQTLAASRPGAPTTDATEPRKTVEPATPGRPATQPAPKPDQLSNAELGRISRAARRTTEGRDYTQDPAWQKQAEVIVERAVKGDVMAMAAAYYLYAYGIGVEKDEDEAAAWARQASDSGLDQGKLALATAYRDGVGVEPSNDAFEQLAGDVDPITMAATGFALTQLDYKDPRAILAAGKLGGKILGGDNPFQSKPKSPGQALKKFDQEHAELYQHINSERIKLKKVDRQIRGIDEAADDLKQALQASRSRYTREQNAELDEAVVQLDRGIKHLRAADLDVATLNASIDEVYDASMWIGDVLAAAEGKAENQSKPAGRHAAATDEDEDDEQENDPKKSKPLEDLGNILKKPPWAR